MTVLANHLRSLSADLLKAAEALQALEAERDEYRRMARLACEVIERESLPVTYSERIQVEVFLAKSGE